MPPVLSSWAAVFAAQELMYRCEQHLSGSGFSFLIFFGGAQYNAKSEFRGSMSHIKRK